MIGYIYVPIEYTDAVRDSMITHVPINSILHVCDCLREREFQQLLEDDSFCNALRTRCLLCGKILTIGGPSAEHDLARNLHAEHSEPRQAIIVLIEMLQHFHENDSERTCEWCLADLTQHADGDVYCARSVMFVGTSLYVFPKTFWLKVTFRCVI